MGAGDFLFNGQLGSNALPDLFRGPAARGQSFTLGGGRAGDTDDFVELVFGGGLEQERDDDEGERAIFPPPDFHLREPADADARVQDGFQSFPGGDVGKNSTGQLVPFQGAVGRQNIFTKDAPDFGQRGLAGLDQLASDLVGVYYRHTGL